MLSELNLRYKALPDAKRADFQRFMKPVRSALLFRLHYDGITKEQYCQEFDAATHAVLRLVEETSDDQG